MIKAFDGIRVVDFSQVLAGPFAAGQLAIDELGAIWKMSVGTGR